MKRKVIYILVSLILVFGFITCDNGDKPEYEQGAIEEQFIRDYGMVNDDFFDNTAENLINDLFNPSEEGQD